MNRNNYSGWLIVDKPSGITSARVVSAVKRIVKTKVGHAGTLDPLASGILPIAIGEATKTVRFMMDSAKVYKFTITFGEATDTDDSEGSVIETSDILPTREDILSAIPDFVGDIIQTPPSYSAIKVNGRRSYDLAREGRGVELKSRIVKIYDLKLLTPPLRGSRRAEGDSVGGRMDIKKEEAPPRLSFASSTPPRGGSKKAFDFEMTCGKGTYVRSVARDLSKKLGTCGHVSVLRRTKVGKFCEKRAILLEKLKSLGQYASPLDELSGDLLPIETVLDDIPVLVLDSSASQRLRNGLTVNHEFTDGTVCVLFEGRLVAICEAKDNILKSVRGFN